MSSPSPISLQQIYLLLAARSFQAVVLSQCATSFCQAYHKDLNKRIIKQN